MSTLDDVQKRKLAREAARVWGFTYEVYLLQYLNSGPVSFGQRTPMTRSSVPPSGGVLNLRANIDLLDHFDPLDELRKEYKDARDRYRIGGGSPRLRWLAELEFALKALMNLHAAHEAKLEDYLKLCAWQAAQSARGVRESMSSEGRAALAYLENKYSNPFGDSEHSQLGGARISDEQSELQIVSGEYPRYTYQVTVDRAFSEVCDVVIRSMGVREERDSKKWGRDACGRLLPLGPALTDEPAKEVREPKDAMVLDYVFPVRRQPDEDDWTGENAKVYYRSDLSENSSTMRLDFSMLKSDDHGAALDPDPLLEEDSGYYLIRKSVAKVGRTDLIVQRSLWFTNRAFGMNAALRPLFKMMVDHRVLREFARLCSEASPGRTDKPSTNEERAAVESRPTDAPPATDPHRLTDRAAAASASAKTGTDSTGE